jgi:Galactose oxidase, central domain/Kelch motif
MAQEVRLQATITGEITVGANPQLPNEFALTIENKGDVIVAETRTPPNLYLKGKLGQGEGALFATKEDARDNCTVVKPAGWEHEWAFPTDDAFFLKFYTYDDTLFAQGAAIKITLSRVISKTAPGQAALLFETDLSKDSQALSVAKTAKTPGIIYFASDPEQGVKNLPFDSVTLKWRTFQLDKRELTQYGAGPRFCDFSKDEGSTTITCGSVDVTFKLKGYPTDGSQPIERDLVVKVLQPNWYGQKNTLYEGDPGFPHPAEREARDALKLAGKRIDLEPTLLLNANDQSLYGIFRYVFQAQERAMLFQTTNPFGAWKFIQASVPDQQGSIPEGFSTSPGVYFNDSLWLIGGSQIDPEIVSNDIWCLDPKQKTWQKQEPATWSPRMGHAVLVFQNKIWLLGGRDAAGNTLNDVWFLDVGTKKWTPLGNAPWTPRCLFSPAVFQDQIWLYGGAQEPFSSTLYDDVYVYKNGNWTKAELTGIITGSASRKPIASCLQVFNNRLCLFGKFRTVNAVDKSESIEPLAFSLSTPSTKTWDSFPSDGLKDWGDDTTFSYRLVNYRNKMLIATALSYQTANTITKVYVPA